MHQNLGIFGQNMQVHLNGDHEPREELQVSIEDVVCIRPIITSKCQVLFNLAFYLFDSCFNSRANHLFFFSPGHFPFSCITLAQHHAVTYTRVAVK